MKKLIILLLTIVSSSIFCQKKNIIREFSLPEKTPLFASYYGNLGIHPGVKIGFEYSLFLKEKTKEKKRKIKKIRKNLILAPSVAFYSHRNSHSGLLVSGDLLWRRYTKRLFISELGVGLGLYTKFNSGTTYEVTTNGIEEKGMTARSYFTPTLSYSFGKRFNFNKEIPTEIYFRYNYHILSNYNNLIGNELSAEIGVRMSLNFGLNQGKVKTKIKNKLK